MAYRIVNTVDNPGDGERERIPSPSAEKKDSGVANGSGKKMDEDEERDAVFFRLEMLGYRVGQGLVERLVVFWGLGSEFVMVLPMRILENDR